MHDAELAGPQEITNQGRDNKSVVGYGDCSFFDDAMTPENGWCKNFKALNSS